MLLASLAGAGAYAFGGATRAFSSGAASAGGVRPLLRQHPAGPSLVSRMPGVKMQAGADGASDKSTPHTGSGPLARLRSALPPPAELKKVTPLGGIFFFILFAYTILRDTKDVLVVTAPGSGAEIIPFLKTYVNLPGAIGFTVLYSKLSNKYSQQQVSSGFHQSRATLI